VAEKGQRGQGAIIAFGPLHGLGEASLLQRQLGFKRFCRKQRRGILDLQGERDHRLSDLTGFARLTLGLVGQHQHRRAIEKALHMRLGRL